MHLETGSGEDTSETVYLTPTVVGYEVENRPSAFIRYRDFEVTQNLPKEDYAGLQYFVKFVYPNRNELEGVVPTNTFPGPTNEAWFGLSDPENDAHEKLDNTNFRVVMTPHTTPHALQVQVISKARNGFTLRVEPIPGGASVMDPCKIDFLCVQDLQIISCGTLHIPDTDP